MTFTRQKFRLFAVLASALLAGLSARAQPQADLLGTWRVMSMVTEFQASGERRELYGKNPRGYLIFTPEGRFMAIITGEGRKPAKSTTEQLSLFTTMFAYTGMYRIEADAFVTKVDTSWNEVWTGTDQTRHFRFDGGRLEITSAWVPSPNLPEKPMVRAVLTVERSR